MGNIYIIHVHITVLGNMHVIYVQRKMEGKMEPIATS